MNGVARIYLLEWVHTPPGKKVPHGVMVRAAGISGEDALDNARARFGGYFAEKYPGGRWHLLDSVKPVTAELA